MELAQLLKQWTLSNMQPFNDETDVALFRLSAMYVEAMHILQATESLTDRRLAFQCGQAGASLYASYGIQCSQDSIWRRQWLQTAAHEFLSLAQSQTSIDLSKESYVASVCCWIGLLDLVAARNVYVECADRWGMSSVNSIDIFLTALFEIHENWDPDRLHVVLLDLEQSQHRNLPEWQVR